MDNLELEFRKNQIHFWDRFFLRDSLYYSKGVIWAVTKMPNIFIFLEADVLGGRLGERLFPRNSFIVISPGLNSTKKKSLKRKWIARVMFQAGILGLANLNFTMKIVPKRIWKIKQNLTAQILVVLGRFWLCPKHFT